LCRFLLSQAMVALTTGREGKRRRSWARPTRSPVFCAVAREPTRRQWRWLVEETRRHCSCAQKPSLTLFWPAEGLPCNFRLFWGYYCNCNVIFV
jgi:hypothetical protein